MKLPVIEGIIRRRILANYRVRPTALERVLPSRFCPKLHAGYAIAGVCLIRLEQIRPRNLPSIMGMQSENAAHRIAVLWDDSEGRTHEGVFITRRDTDSRLNHYLGGRLFPGEHHLARFEIEERDSSISLSMTSCDAAVDVGVQGCICDNWSAGSAFHSLDEASQFFEVGRLGYSVTRDPHRLDGIVLKTHEWHVRPLEIKHIHSSYFDDRATFPPGSVEFDHAPFMSDIAHEWHSAGDLCV